jgi:prepilin peptidase CpaA
MRDDRHARMTCARSPPWHCPNLPGDSKTGAPMMQLVTACLRPTMLGASAVLLLLAGASDIAARRVPNRVPAALAAIGVVLRVQSGDLIAALGCAFAVFIVAFVCWQRGWLGGGDVKLLAAAALLVAPDRVPGLVIAVALAGGVLAAAYLLMRALLPEPRLPSANQLTGRRPRLLRVLRAEQWRIRRRAPLPYASAIFAGVAFTLLSR